MEHNAPHHNAAFEGWYSKFDLPSGAHLAIIVCSVRKAKTRPHMLSFTYVPEDVANVFQREIWADDIKMSSPGPGHAFELVVPGTGYVRWAADSATEYHFQHEDFTFHGETISRTQWSAGTDTPEGFLVRLPLPLHWHVHSLGSVCDFSLSIASQELPPADRLGAAVVHQEKNWAHGFPSAHMWVQARSGEERGFCCAGGRILGVEAFLVGYRSEACSVDFRPPFALRVAGWSPFMSYATDWDARGFEMSVQGLWRKLTVRATAPRGTFFALSAPFADGHELNALGESFQAVLEVKVYEGGLFSPWRLVHEDRFEGASLEFGGDYYPPRGTDSKIH